MSDDLDQKISERVMGVKTVTLPEGAVQDVIIPAFSTDLSTAWGVVDQMASLGKNFILSNSDVGNVKSPGKFWAAFGFDSQKILVVAGETAAEAICNAALKAVEK